MIKQLILLIHVLGLFFYQLIFTGDITVNQRVPDSITQGKEAIIEVTINKGNLPGFAKVQQVFPAGFTAEPIETKGATFSFKDDKVKFIWMALPLEEEFTISYKITPNEETAGNFTLGGKFSFISESERKNIEIPVANFAVVTEELVAEVVPEEEDKEEEVAIEEPVEEEPVEEELVVEEVEEEEVVEEPVVEEPVVEEEVAIEEPVVEEVVEEVPNEEENVIKIETIKCTRVVENVEERKYKITIEINKNGIEGFAKITESIPEGFIAKEVDSKGGVFSFKENTAKILWMAIPKEETYTVEYTLEANTSTLNGTYNIKGDYSYLENDKTSKYTIDGSSFDLNATELITEVTPEETVEEVAVVDEPVVEEVVEEEPVIEEVVAELPKEEPVTEEIVEEDVVADNSSDITTTPNPENGVTYKVQVGAGHKTVPATYFKTKFNLQDNVSTINHEGWIKYLVGSYNEYKMARDKRNKVRNNVKTAFVTAYNVGTRITVQEALMISNQKWFK